MITNTYSNMEVQENILTASMIIKAVSKVTDIPITDIKARNRKRAIVDARRLAIFFIYDNCGLSLKATGALFDGLDHSSVLYSNESYFDLYATDKEFREKVIKVKRELNI